MAKLSAFLAQNAIKHENESYVASKRFVDSAGNPIAWEICCVSSTEDEALRKSCMKRVQVPGKRGQYVTETDYNQYIGKLAARCTVFPDLSDAELQNSYGVMGEDALLKAMLTPGEYLAYSSKVQQVNGFENSFEDTVDEAKN